MLGITGGAAAVHAVGWYANSRRFAVGTDGPWLFAGDAEWSPPLGWTPWMVVVAAGAIACALSGLAAARRVEARVGSGAPQA